MKILITGFEPFGGEKVNPSFEAVKRLPTKISYGTIIKLEVPTVFGEAGKVLREAILREKPQMVICVGQAGGRSMISLEKVAINLIEARIPDNAGNQPMNQIIEKEGETAYFTSLPIKAMKKHIEEKGLPAEISYTAGTFVCNELMYRLLFMIQKDFPQLRGGFIHVPFLPSQTIGYSSPMPSMPLETITTALAYGIEAAIENETDIEDYSGTLH